MTIDNSLYHFGEKTGVLKIGWSKTLNGNAYYSDESGKIQVGTFVVDGIEHKTDENGVVQTGFQTSNGKTYFFYSDGTYATGITKIGDTRYQFLSTGELVASNVKVIIDVSHHQGIIDWDTLWNSGAIDGVILRIGYSLYEDSMFSTYIQEIKRLNIPYSVYLFSYAHNGYEASLEANAFVNMFQKYQLSPMFDVFYDLESYVVNLPGEYETSDDISKETYQEIADNFISNLAIAGISSSIYTNLNYANTRFTEKTASQVKWIAHYTSGDTEYYKKYQGWQFTSSGTVPGISGNVDMSVFYY